MYCFKLITIVLSTYITYVLSDCDLEDGTTVFSSTHPLANGCYNFYRHTDGFKQFIQESGAAVIRQSSDHDKWEFVFENTIFDFIVCSTNSEAIGNPGNGDVHIESCSSGESLPIELSFSCGCETPIPNPDSDPRCEFGLIKNNICCSSECGICGGVGCGARPGKGSNCCGEQIVPTGVSCNDDTAPCIIDKSTPSPTPSREIEKQGFTSGSYSTSRFCLFSIFTLTVLTIILV